MARTGRGFPTHPQILGTRAVQTRAVTAATFSFLAFGADGSSVGIRHSLNPASYAGTVTAYLEIQGYTSSPTLTARLYNATLAAPVPGATVSLTSTTLIRAISLGFSLDTGDNTYEVQYGGVSGGFYTLKDAVLSLVIS